MEVYEVEKVTIVLEGREHELPAPVGLAALNKLAVEGGIARYTLEREDGQLVAVTELPLTEGRYVMKEYNEAK